MTTELRDPDAPEGGLDAGRLVRAFERLAAEAVAEDAAAALVLEAASMAVALGELELFGEASTDLRALAGTVRRTLLGAAMLRAAAAEREDAEDALDALALAVDQARLGAQLLGGASRSHLDGSPTDEPTPRDLARLLRGELDGHAAADVAVRLHRSAARERYAAFLPARHEVARVRLAADAAPKLRDPSSGRRLGTRTLRPADAGADVTLEAFAFDGGVVAIYAEPAIAVGVLAVDVPLAARLVETAGYVELALAGDPSEVTLDLDGGRRDAETLVVRWTLHLG